MAKLIKAEALEHVKKSTVLYNNSAYTEAARNSLIFTADGYIVTKGIEYYVGTAKPGSLNANSGVSITNGVLKITDANGNVLTKTATLPIWKAGKGLSVSNGEVGHSNSITASSTGPTAGSSSSIAVPKITYDAYGHITGATTYTATLDKVKSTARGTTAMSLIGHTAAGTANVLIDTNVTVTTADSKVWLTTPALSVTGGADNVKLNGTTLTDYVNNAVASSTSQAMVFKDTFTPSTTEANATLPSVGTVANGDTYKVASAGFIRTEDKGPVYAVKPGDVIIAKVGTTTTWSLIPAGDESETFITVSNTKSTGTYNKATGNITLGNAALYIVGTTKASVASNNDTLVTGGAVYAAISGHAGIDKTGTVTTVGVSADSGLLISSTSNGTYGTTAQSTTAYYKVNLKDYTKDTLASSSSTRLVPVKLDKDGKLAVAIPESYKLINAKSASATSVEAGTFINLVDTISNSAKGSVQLASSGIITVSGANNKITIGASISTTTSVPDAAGTYPIGTITLGTATTYFRGYNTWRDVIISTISNSLINAAASIKQKDLRFSQTFALNAADEVDLVWAEVDAAGAITYTV